MRYTKEGQGGVGTEEVRDFLFNSNAIFILITYIFILTVSQQQFQPRMQITQDFIFDKLICYSYVQEYVIE